MRYNLEKCIQLTNDLVMHCYALGAEQYHIDFDIQGQGYCSFQIKAAISSLDEGTLDEMKRSLNADRSHEVEELYWAISSDTDSTAELVTIGMMLDEAEAEYDGETLTIHAMRKS